MKNYTDSCYALNKYSEGIVYHFADSTVEITLSDFLRENPKLTAKDFMKLKEESDAIYREQDRADNAQTKKNLSFDGLDDSILCSRSSLEDDCIAAENEIERQKEKNEQLQLAYSALDVLTTIQRRRYLMHYADGTSTYEIAELEHKDQKTVYESIRSAVKKINKIIKNV